MIKVELTSKQVEELRNYYLLELKKLQQRTTVLTELLNAIAAEPILAEYPKAGKGLKQSKAKSQSGKEISKIIQKEKPKRRGRPAPGPSWSDFVIELMKKENRPLSKEQIFTAYQDQHKVDLTGSTTAMRSLSQTLQRLRVKKNLVRSIPQEGKRTNLYGLVSHSNAQITILKKPAKINKEKKDLTLEEAAYQDSKSKWPQFIIDTLRKTNRVLTKSDFLRHAVVNFSIPNYDKSSTRNKISKVLSQMVKETKRLKTVKKPGINLPHYGLVEWFNENKKLIPEYK